MIQIADTIVSNTCLNASQFSLRSADNDSNLCLSACSACSFLGLLPQVYLLPAVAVFVLLLFFFILYLSFSSLSLFLRSSSSLRFCSSANLTNLSCSNSFLIQIMILYIRILFYYNRIFVRTISCVISSIICFAS